MRHFTCTTRTLIGLGLGLAAGVLAPAACSDDDASLGTSTQGSDSGGEPGGEGDGGAAARIVDDFSCDALDLAALSTTTGLQLDADAIEEQALGGGPSCDIPDVNADDFTGLPELTFTVREPLTGVEADAGDDPLSDLGDEAWWDREDGFEDQLIAREGGIAVSVVIYDDERDVAVIEDATIETARELLDQLLR